MSGMALGHVSVSMRIIVGRPISSDFFLIVWHPEKKIISALKFMCFFPLFLSFCIGIGLYVSYGVIQGYLGVKSEFVRTPKFNVINKFRPSINVYGNSKLKPIFFIEFSIVLYSFFGLFYSFYNGSYFMLVFLIMIFIGSSYSSLNSIKHAIHKGK